MHWLADECVHSPVVDELRNVGHDVVYAAEVARQTADVLLADEALREQRILLTEDKDFGEIVFLHARTRRARNRLVALFDGATCLEVAPPARGDRRLWRRALPALHGHR